MFRELPRRALRGVKREFSPPPPTTKDDRALKRRATVSKPGPSKRRESIKQVEEVVEEPIEVTPSSPIKPIPVEILPTKIGDHDPLPVLPEPQSKNLSIKEYQSIAESAVLAASLERSRHAWLHNTMFERFWSKAHYKKKKEMTEEERKTAKSGHQPAGKSGAKPPMIKVGDCKLKIAPHVFDITVYVVKDTSQPPVYAPAPTPQPFVQCGPAYRPSSPALSNNSNSVKPAKDSTPRPSFSQAQPAGQGRAPSTSTFPTSDPTPPVAANPTIQMHVKTESPFTTSTPPPPPQPPQPQPSVTVTKIPAPVSGVVPPPARPRPTINDANTTVAKPAIAKPDPVIAKLAERAQANKELKGIMQLVATGAASIEQLNFFQRHINEITLMVRREEAAAAAKAATAKHSMPPASAHNALTSTPRPNSTPTTAPPQTTSTAATRPPQTQNIQNNLPPSAHVGAKMHAPSPSLAGNQKPVNTSYTSRPPLPTQSTHQQARYHPPQSQPAPARKQPIIVPLHVLMEFSGNTVDRFSFPKSSILEFSKDMKSCLCSFIVVRKGSTAANLSRFDAETEYWQPITVELSASDPTLLSYFARVVKAPDVVKKEMMQIMGTKKRVEDGFLPLRLPRKRMGLDVGGED